MDADQGSSQEIHESSNETSCPPLLFVGANKAIQKYAWLSTYMPLHISKGLSFVPTPKPIPMNEIYSAFYIFC